MSFIPQMQQVIQSIEKEEKESIRMAAKTCAGTIADGRAVLLFGAGHSALPAQEAFPRIGSIVGFVQITEPVLGFNGHVTGKGGQRQMSFIEQTSGFAKVIMSNYNLTPQDTLIVFSNSGINALPVELCHLANEQGLTTISISSTAHSLANAPKNPLGKRLLEIADIHIDNHTPEGDALVQVSADIRVGSGSTIAAMVIMNAIVVETIALLNDQEVPFYLYPSHNISENVKEVMDKEAALFEAHKALTAKL